MPKKNVMIIQFNANPIKTKEEEKYMNKKGLFKCQKMKMKTKKRAKRHPKQ
jgi:hypothetical protein